MVVAIKNRSGHMEFNPTFRSTVSPGDILIVVGEGSKLNSLEVLARRP